MKVIIIHPGEPSYLYGLVYGLSKIKDLELYVIGADRSLNLLNRYPNVKFLNFRGSLNPNVTFTKKMIRNVKYYLKTTIFILSSDAKLVHIQWFNNYFLFESTFLIWLYKIFGKKIIYTAHNVNQGKRDNNNSKLQFLLLQGLYNRVDRIIVHNGFSKRELAHDFNISEDKISVNKLGINMQVPKNGINSDEARKFFSIENNKKVLLFLGGLNYYKGVDLLIESFNELIANDDQYMLIVAGESRNREFVNIISTLIKKNGLENKIIFHLNFVPDDDIEKYFMAADCLVLPYRHIYQSGLHVSSYSFGTPVITTDVGNFKEEDVIEEKTGFVCEASNIDDLVSVISKYFNSYSFKHLAEERNNIRHWAETYYSWERIGSSTYKIYSKHGKSN